MRFPKNTAVLMKLETVYGTDSIPAGATDALLVRQFSCKPVDAKYVNNPEIRDYFGGSVDLVGHSLVSGSFEIALFGSGAVDTVAAWAKALRVSGFAEAITALTCVDYTPISAGFESATLYYHDDGVLKKVLGMRADITSAKFGYGDVMILGFSFMGIDGGASAVANPALTLTNWKKPIPINTANSGMLTLGGAYAAGAVTGGVTYPSRGIELKLGGKLNFAEILGGESADITDRDVTGSVSLDLTAAQEVSFEADVKASTTQSVSLLHGTVAGSKILTFLPNVQLKNPTKEVVGGRRLIKYDIKAVPTAGSGNDEWRLVTL